LGSKMGWKTGFWSKNLKPWFLNHHSGWKLEKIKQHFVWFCFQRKLGWTSCHSPRMQQKKEPKRTSQNKIGQTNWLDLLGSTTLNLLFFYFFRSMCFLYFFFKIIIFINNYSFFYFVWRASFKLQFFYFYFVCIWSLKRFFLFIYFFFSSFE